MLPTFPPLADQSPDNAASAELIENSYFEPLIVHESPHNLNLPQSSYNAIVTSFEV